MSAGDGHGFWVALGGAAAWVFARDSRRRVVSRVSRAIIAAAFGYAAAVTEFFPGQNRALVAAAVTAFAHPVLETATAIIEDASFVKDLILGRWFKR